ncbi:alpha amylase N-terminal ig-like domain-containing protein [Planctomycetota bacterium]|nr:alpha amylase N-terminal ig-like domain-containing protein [Planctomycetota bacterium]
MFNQTGLGRYKWSLIVIVMLSFVACVGAAPSKFQHTFRFKPESKIDTVSVVGSFNNWDDEIGAMTRQDDGSWTLDMMLEEGVYHYKFLVDGTKYLEDPTTDKKLTTGDGHGGRNSGIAIGLAAEKVELTGFEMNAVLDTMDQIAGEDVRLKNGKYLHKFVYIPSKFIKGSIDSVSIAGSFNGWNSEADPAENLGDGVWAVSVPLERGIHFYKFVVNGNRWMNDPASDKEFELPDGHEGVNSAVLIGPDGRDLPKVKPNHINTKALVLDGFNVYRKNKALIRLRTQAEDMQHAVLVYKASNEEQWHEAEMEVVERAMGFDVFSVNIETKNDATDVEYYFKATDGNASVYLSDSLILKSAPTADDTTYFASMGYNFDVPEWAQNAIWYQIFPERFRNGDPSNDPKHTKRWTSKWFSQLPSEDGGKDDFYTGIGNVWWRKYGGDVQGLIEALPYLRELGITAIYLNPVFEAESMHKYDATDYRHIDDNFGFKGDIDQLEGESLDPSTWKWSETDKLFLKFIEEAHKQGFKVIIDGVFNHVGPKHFAFQDVLKNGKDSIYADWFDITDWGTGGEPGKPGGLQWNGWGGKNSGLPAWKKDPILGLAEAPSQHIFDVTRRWMAPNGDPSKGVDGWRLDAPNDVPHAFWKRWRKVVKETNPDAYISGEIWHWAQDYLQGDEFDAVMNYLFAQAAQDFFVDVQTQIPPSELSARLNRIIYNYPFQVALAQQNLFDSHDTDRFASMFVNPDLPYDGANRLQDTGPDYDPRRPNAIEFKRMLQAFAFQMTFVGSPMIYYGNEAGMYSPDDPSNRQPMTWPGMKFDDPKVGFNQNVFDGTQKLIAVRNALAPLRTGFYKPILTNDKRNLFGFVREQDDQRVYVIINRSPRNQLIKFPVSANDSGKTFVDVLGKDQSILKIDENDPASRPLIVLSKHAKKLIAEGDTMTVRLRAYETAIIAEPSAFVQE